MSMIATGRGVKKQANAGLHHAAQAESQRNRLNDQIKAAEDAEEKQTMGMIAGAGLELGLKHAATTAAAETAGTAAATTAATTAGTAATGVAGTGVAAGGATATAATAAAAVPYVGIALLAASLFM